MTFYDNWAVLTDETSVLWTFGQVDEDKAVMIANLAKGLYDAVRELFTETVASIQLIDDREVLFVQIGGRFFFIVSDPITTAKLLRLANIPSDVENILLGVLIGHGVQTYANLWSAAQSDFHAELIDKIFQEALDKLALPASANVNIGIHQGACNLSGLSLPDLLFFHSYVRQRIGEERALDPEEKWGFLQSTDGVPIVLEYQIPTTSFRIEITAGIISVICTLIREVMGSNPKKIVFADENLPALDLIVGDDYLLAANYAVSLFREPDFVTRFFALPEEVQDSIAPSLREALSEQILQATRVTLQENDIPTLIDELTQVEPSVPTEIASKSTPDVKFPEEAREDPKSALVKEIESLAFIDVNNLTIPSRPLKLVLVGNGAVGKTSLKNVALGKGFESSYMATIGVDFAARTFRLANQEIRTQLWDLAGQPSFQQIRSSFYAGAHGALAVFDIMQRESLDAIRDWIIEVWKGTKSGPIPVLIIGNKVDLRATESGAMDDAEVQQIIFDWMEHDPALREVPISFIPTSAKSGENVRLAFQGGCARALLALQK
ncbi:MAG: GTP-binding protein [Candidatus Heimdallarchaeota archaeon]